MVAVVPSTQLLEREREIEQLQRAWREARSGRGSAWLVCAEAGGGKTRLLREVARAAVTARWGTAEPIIPPDPYLAVMQALRGFRPAPRRSESVTRAVECLERLAGDGPIMLVLDDLHFADEGTLAVFARLAALSAGRPWLLLGALRPGEGSEAVRLAVTELAAQGQVQRLDLPPLSREGVAALAAGVHGGAVSAPEIDALHADSGGNPWFAEALARGAGAIAAARDRIYFRLDRLEAAIPGSLRLIELLAPAGEPVPHEVVVALHGGDEQALRRLLRTLREARVLRETEDGAWRFQHELTRRSVMEGMLVADRHAAHLRLAGALEGRTSAAVLAMHYAAAADPRAAPWALRAAEEARNIDAHAEALAQLERALAFTVDPEERRTALRISALETHTLGRFADSHRLAEEALAIPGGDPETRSHLHWIAWRAGSTVAEDAEAHLAAAERVLEGQPPGHAGARIAVARVRQAVDHMRPDQFEEALARLSHQLDACAPEQRVTWELESRRNRIQMQLFAGDPAGLSELENLLAFARERRLQAGYSVASLTEGYTLSVLSMLHERSEELYGRATEQMQQFQFNWSLLVLPHRALELVQRGRYEEASAAIAALMGPASDLGRHPVVLAAAALYEGRAGSLERSRRALAAAEGSAPVRHAVLLDLARLEPHLLEGTDGAGDLAAALYAQNERRHYARAAGMAALALARAGRAAPPAPAWLAESSPLRALWDWAGALAVGDAAGLRAVATRLTALALPYEAALALGDAGDLPGAYRSLRALGATTAREQMARRLRAAGGAIPRGPAAGADHVTLTDTERVVCRLVAAGATNEAVASALGIGASTVRAHLTRIYQKTGRQGRAALAGWWSEQESARQAP